MKKKSKKVEAHLGMVREAICRYKKRAGHLRMWDCQKGSPMGLGPASERWAVEWLPGGRGKPLYVHLRNQRTALACIRALSAGKPDQWGLFELLESKRELDVPQNEKIPDPGGGEVAVPSIARDTPLTPALMEAFDTPRVIALLEEMLDAKRPIYATIDGDQQVVGYEPDWPTKREGLKLLLGYRDGTPVKRSEEVKRHEMSPEEAMSLLASNPKTRGAMANLCAYYESRDSKRLENLASRHKAKVMLDAELSPEEK
jgi:hypothetical protein